METANAPDLQERSSITPLYSSPLGLGAFDTRGEATVMNFQDRAAVSSSNNLVPTKA